MINYGKLQIKENAFKIYQKTYIPKIWRAHSNPAFIYFGTEAQCNWSDSCKSVQLQRECVSVTGPAIRHWSNGRSNTLFLYFIKISQMFKKLLSDP